MPPSVLSVLAAQSGVVGRHQLVALGCSDKTVERWVRSRLLVRLMRGAYVDHTGEPTFDQRCWAAVLAHRPAALSFECALRSAEGPSSRRADRGISVITPWETRRVAHGGVEVGRRRDFHAVLHPGSGVPRMRYEEAALDVVEAADEEVERIEQLALAVNSRRTSARRLQMTLARRSRYSSRQLVGSLLEDLETGTCSVLEHGYVTRVERPHGLPTTLRQVRAAVRGRATYRDAVTAHGVCMELDGRLHERFDQREHDFDRDLVTAATGTATVRLSYGQVFGRPCWTASQLAAVHRAHGWSGQLCACGPGCGID